MNVINTQKSVSVSLLFALLITIVISGVGYYFFDDWQKDKLLMEQNAAKEMSIRLLEARLKQTRGEVSDLSSRLLDEQDVNTNLAQNLQAEQERNNLYGAQLRDISTQVNTLQKLSATDKELLKKYSKVYFLSENYIPAKLSWLPPKYTLHSERPESLHTDALPFLIGMLDEASSSIGTLRVVSAYRSFEDQQAVKTGYKLLYGSGANRFSADQGYSEHQLGTTVDLTTPTLGGLSLKFEAKSEYMWLVANAYRFGFVLSYPRSNSYYQFEPWHWRFVGVTLATKLHAEGKYFYDLTQREIDTYLISIFDR